MKIFYLLFIAILLISGNPVIAQFSVTTDGSSADPSAMLEVKSTNKGALLPRMTQAQIGAIVNPANGLIVFCTTDNKFYAFVSNDYIWKEILYGTNTINPPFACGNALVDSRDGQSYTTVGIGTQCWMAQNLDIGMKILGSANHTNNSIIEKYCYNDDDANCAIYGGLYQWNEAMQYSTTPGVTGICPTGWHLPTDAEWTTLTTYVKSQSLYQCNSPSELIAKAMAAATLWNSSTNTCAVGNNLSSNNATGFSALPGGYRYDNGAFYDIGIYGGWWSSSESRTDYAWYRYVYYCYSYVYRSYYYYKGGTGFSVRCLRDY
jgi:uncharacterized protein (TIGR02145 family)